MAKNSKRREHNNIGEGKNMQTTRPVTKPAKQRKLVFQAPSHVRYKLFAAPLSSELKASHGVSTIPVRSGDTVRVMRGDHKGFEGKITNVNRKGYRIYVEGLTREKVDGTATFVAIHPSKVMITNLNLDDKWRKKILERKKGVHKKAEEVAKKPLEKAVKKLPETAAVKEKVIEEKMPVEEKTPKKKPAAKKRRTAKKPVVGKTEEEPKEAKKEEKPKAERKRAKRKTTKKIEGGA